MKKNTILSAIALLLFPSIASSQPKLPGQWSLIVDVGYSIPASSSMNGTAAEFRSDLNNGYNNHRYPFGDKRAISSTWGAQLSYRFPASPWSIYGEQRAYFSYVDNGFGFDEPLSENASLFDYVTGIGMEYTWGQPSDAFNAFGKAGLVLSSFVGDVNYFGGKTDLEPTFRGGVDIAGGERWNMSFAPLALELTANYINANLIGKSYEKPGVSPPNALLKRALNDGANPDDPTDASKTIAYLSFRLGLGVWF